MTTAADFEDIVDRYSAKVYNHALRVLGNREPAEEAAQDVFLRVYRSLDSFRGEASLSTWIWRITANVCYARVSASRRIVGPDDGSGNDPDLIPDLSPDPERLLIETEAMDEITDAIAQLSLREATAITLFYLEELDYREISEILEIPQGTVATALHRGREKLRRMLDGRRQGRDI